MKNKNKISNGVKILFINPPALKALDPSLPKVLQEEEDPMPPLGLMYLTAYLGKNSSHEPAILDCPAEKLNLEQIKNRIKQENPDAVGITVMTFTLLNALKMIEIVKEIKSSVKIILGGPHPHIFPEETLNLPGVDFLILGEGEIALKNLLDNLNEPKKLYQIQGLAFKDGGKAIVNLAQEFIQDLDSLPFPARHLTPYQKYGSSLAKRFPVTTMFTSRGCPYKCLFCDRPHLGKFFRARSAKNVVDEFEQCAKMGIKEIFIYDDTFGVDRQRVLDICSEIIKRKIEMAWDIRTRVNTVDKEILAALKKAGCQRIHYGVEAGTQKILNVLRKGITLEMAEEAFHLTKNAGIQTLGYFIIGSPSETKEEILTTIKFAKKLNSDFAHFTIMTPYPATDLYRLGLEKGILKKDYWREFAANPSLNFEPPVWEEIFTKKELSMLLKKAYRSFYFRPNYIFRRIKEVSSLKELFTKAAMALKLLKI